MIRNKITRYRAIGSLAWALLYTEWSIRSKPFDEIAKRLSKPLVGDGNLTENLEAAREVRGDLNSLCRHLPWTPTCLVRAITAQAALAKKKVSTTLVLGVKPGEKNKIDAHAWLEAAGIVVTGKNEMGSFEPIHRFENHPQKGTISACS